jgi:hypothetical protein
LLPLLPWCSVSNQSLFLVSFRTPCSWDILRGRSIATRDTVVLMNIEVPTKYLLSQERIVVFEIRLDSKSPMLYRPALHGNWNALSLARRALKDKRFHSQLCYQVVRYFCRILYIRVFFLYL